MSDGFLDLVGGEAPVESAWRDVAVHVRIQDGGLALASRRLLGRGRELADQLGCYLKAVCSTPAPAAFRFGADRVFAGEAALFIEREKPEILLFDEGAEPAALAASLAQRFRTGFGEA